MHRTTRPPGWLIALGAALLAGFALIVAKSLRRTTPPTFAIDDRAPMQTGPRLVNGRTTVDARADDRWAFFDFSRNAAVAQPDSLGWDIAVRRTRWIVNGGASFAGRGGAVAIRSEFDSVRSAPERAYRATVIAGGDSLNPAFDRWYQYDYLSHLLWPKPITFVIRTADGRYAKLSIVSYYCAGPEPGCVTFRYAYQGDGSRRFAAEDE